MIKPSRVTSGIAALLIGTSLAAAPLQVYAQATITIGDWKPPQAATPDYGISDELAASTAMSDTTEYDQPITQFSEVITAAVEVTTTVSSIETTAPTTVTTTSILGTSLDDILARNMSLDAARATGAIYEALGNPIIEHYEQCAPTTATAPTSDGCVDGKRLAKTTMPLSYHERGTTSIIPGRPSYAILIETLFPLSERKTVADSGISFTAGRYSHEDKAAIQIADIDSRTLQPIHYAVLGGEAACELARDVFPDIPLNCPTQQPSAFYEQGGFWGVVGAAAAMIGGVIVYTLSQPDQTQQGPGNPPEDPNTGKKPFPGLTW